MAFLVTFERPDLRRNVMSQRIDKFAVWDNLIGQLFLNEAAP
jgi:hypothetical protein